MLSSYPLSNTKKLNKHMALLVNVFEIYVSHPPKRDGLVYDMDIVSIENWVFGWIESVSPSSLRPILCVISLFKFILYKEPLLIYTSLCKLHD